MKAKEIHQFFLNLAPWIDGNKTLDKIIIGNPEKEINKVLISWMSTKSAVEYAVENKFDMLITHECTFWIHENELENLDKWGKTFDKYEAAEEKRQFILDNDLVVLRNHDVWDTFPEHGIPWALAKYLDIHKKPTATNHDNMQHRYDIDPISVNELAKFIAKKTKSLGETSVQVFGDLNLKVSKLGIGTGCGSKINIFKDLGCDVSIVCDDGNWYWQQITWAQEINHPVIRINHATSEEPGMMSMVDFINDNIQGITAEYFKHDIQMNIVGEV